MKGVNLRGGVYYYRGSVDGKIIQKSLGTADEAEAVNKAKALIAEHAQPSDDAWAPEKPKPIEFGAAIEQFVTYKRGLHNSMAHTRMQVVVIQGAATQMRWKDPAAVTRAQVEAWMKTKPNPRTRIQYLEILARFFRWLVEKKRIPRNPCDGIERPKRIPRAVRRRFLSPEDAEKLLSVPYEPLPSTNRHKDPLSDDELKFVLFCSLHAGLRRGEVCAARLQWFDLKHGLLHIASEGEAGQSAIQWQPKDGDDRAIPLTARFREFLTGYIERHGITETPGRPSPFMLRPDKKSGRHLYRVEFAVPFNRHLKACGVKCTFHDLRRTFASLHVSAGTPIYKVARWLGDGIAVVERHYAHLHHSGDDIERAWQQPSG